MGCSHLEGRIQARALSQHLLAHSCDTRHQLRLARRRPRRPFLLFLLSLLLFLLLLLLLLQLLLLQLLHLVQMLLRLLLLGLVSLSKVTREAGLALLRPIRNLCPPLLRQPKGYLAQKK